MTTPHQERADIAEKIDELAARMDALEHSVSGLVKAWEGATWLVAAIKWVSTVAVALSAFWWVLRNFGDKPQ